MSQRSRGLALCFEKLQGWTVPVHLLQDMDLHDYDITLQLSLSLFHLRSRTFFGSSWMGSPVSLSDSGKDVLPDVLDINYLEIIYMFSRITDPSCVAAVEIVVSKTDKYKKILLHQYGCGWTMLTLFAHALQEVSYGYNATPLSSSTLYKGSPRDLIPLAHSLTQNASIKDLMAKLHELPGCVLQYRLFQSSQLLKAQKLISENEIIGRFDVVGGLATKGVTLPTELRLRKIACIGDREEIVEKKGVILVPAAPQLSRTLRLQIVDWHLMIPARSEYESRVRTMVTKQMNLLNSAKSKIVSRKLKIGLHNGHSLITGQYGGEWLQYTLEEDSGDPDVLLTSEEFVSISVDNYPPHESVGLVLLVEYDIGVEIDEASQYDAVSTIKAALKEGDLLVSTVSLGATVFLPFHENRFELRNISLPPGEAPSNDSLSIELELDTDDLCRLISPNLIFRDDHQSFKKKQETEEEEDTDIVVGFDLKVFDRKREYKHGDLFEDDDAESIDETTTSMGAESPRRRKPTIQASSVQRDDDDFGREPSLVGGSSEASSLRLDPQYYGTYEGSLASLDQGDRYFPKEFTRNTILPPTDPNSLLRRSLKTHLSDVDKKKPFVQDEDYLEARGEGTRAAPRPVMEGGNFSRDSHAREMTRASKSRLSRHGFSDAIGDSIIQHSPMASAHQQHSNKYARDVKATQSVDYQSAVKVGNLIPVDLDVEATDNLSINEITLQFGGYRVGTVFSKKETSSETSSKPRRLMHSPHSIYCTYQFYTCRPTRTEAMRLLPPSESNSFSVLVREESTSRRIETPLLLRHIIDSGNVSTLEGYEFAEYLAYGTLYIDVWDSDSLLHIGVVAFPLRSLMRQGKLTSKITLECDIVNHDLSVMMDRNGLSTSVMIDGQAPLGLVVGSLSIIASNMGAEGKKTKRIEQTFMEHGVNWRASVAPGKVISKRPKNSVRARPLSESSPDLHQVLEDHRQSGDSKATKMRSLSSVRGNEGLATLTYDEVITLFKRFKGTANGTVQYEGPLLKLLDVPSWSVATRKLIKMFKKSRLRGNTLKNKLLEFADARGLLSVLDLQEFLQDSFEQYGIAFRLEEIAIIASKVLPSVDPLDVPDSNGRSYIRPDDFIKFCTVEADRQDWVLASRRIKRTIQKALVAGIDVEQLIAEKESAGDDQISIVNFKLIMTNLSKFGKFSPQDVDIIVRYLSTTPSDPQRTDLTSNPNTLSAKMVAGFLGIKYTGNIEARLRRCICSTADRPFVSTDKPRLPLDSVFVLANQTPSRSQQVTAATRSKCYSRISYDDMEDRLKALRVYNFASHEQVKGVLSRAADSSGTSLSDGLSVIELLNYLKIDFSEHLNLPEQQIQPTKSLVGVTAEDLLKLLIDKAATDTAGIDQVFRHFDADGNGSITEEELVSGLENLRIFDAIPNWKSQIPDLMTRFDASGDGSVSLSEFFKFLGAEKYIPNIIQKMTKVFAKSNLSLQNVFTMFDTKQLGYIRGEQLQTGLAEIGGFDELSPEDLGVIIRTFDDNGDGKITAPEFVSFFTARVQQTKKEARQKNTIRLKRRLQEVMKTVVESGGTIEQIFSHFDADSEGTISREELAAGITAMKHFKQLKESEVQDLVALLDTDGDGTISLQEFKDFINISPEAMKKINKEQKTNQILERLRAILKGAQAQKKSPQEVFAHLDKNGDGDLTLAELKEGLLKIRGFSSFPEEVYQDLFRRIDRDGSNSVTVDEFIGLIMKETDSPRASPRASPRSSPRATAAGKKKVEEEPPPNAQDLPKNFCKRVLRLSENEAGGLAGLIAFLDDDEDGLVSFNRLMRFFSREELFDRYLTESQVDELLTPLVRKDGKMRADHLMKFIENGGSNREFLNEAIEDFAPYQSDEEDADDVAGTGEGEKRDEYEYSPDPEIRAIEKKLRDLGNKLSKKGVDIENLFKNYDPRHCGVIRRTEFLEILSSMGMYILERGKAMTGSGDSKRSIYDTDEGDQTRLSQQRQIERLKQRNGGYGELTGRAAKKFVGKTQSDFKDHLESLAMIDWYRQGQKRMLLQRVLSHSLASVAYIYPRFGKTLFFEYPLTNPFGHEERFVIEIPDPELRVVSSFDEWTHLRNTCRPCIGSIGTEPVEADMFDVDGVGNIAVSLLSHETLYLPFTFLTFQDTTPLPSFPTRQSLSGATKRSASWGRGADDKSMGRDSRGGGSKQSNGNGHQEDEEQESVIEENPSRTIDIRIISGSHGHVVAVLKIHVCPRPFSVSRNLIFYEPENTIMKRRIQIKGNSTMAMFPNDRVMASKYIHSVEINQGGEGEKGTGAGQVLVEWGPSESDLSGQGFTGAGSLDVIVRYRCLSFPSSGSFYILLYNDPYQASLHEVWYVTVQTRQRLDLHCALGSRNSVDLVIRGDKFSRRVRAFNGVSYTPCQDSIAFQPESFFQLVPGAYNRVLMTYAPRVLGSRRTQVNVVDVDTRELVSSWLLLTNVTSPAVVRTYDVDVLLGRPVLKKIVFKNPWDLARKFTLVSSDETLMRPRTEDIEVAGHGTAYLKLWFSGVRAEQEVSDVYLFLNDDTGHSEDCFLFQVQTTEGRR